MHAHGIGRHLDATPVARPPRVARRPRTRLTKPECHCPAWLLEQIVVHGTGAAGSAPRAAVKAPAPAGGIL
jgi:hypothetical protein